MPKKFLFSWRIVVELKKMLLLRSEIIQKNLILK